MRLIVLNFFLLITTLTQLIAILIPNTKRKELKTNIKKFQTTAKHITLEHHKKSTVKIATGFKILKYNMTFRTKNAQKAPYKENAKQENNVYRL